MLVVAGTLPAHRVLRPEGQPRPRAPFRPLPTSHRNPARGETVPRFLAPHPPTHPPTTARCLYYFIFMQDEREPQMDPHLFPEQAPSGRRPFEFEGKDVVFVSARVHPGETPASFVFQGILRFVEKG